MIYITAQNVDNICDKFGYVCKTADVANLPTDVCPGSYAQVFTTQNKMEVWMLSADRTWLSIEED